MKVLFATALSLALMSPVAVAQDAELYIVQDKSTKRCSVSDKKPTSESEVVIVNDGIYRTRIEAETGIEKIKACDKNRS